VEKIGSPGRATITNELWRYGDSPATPMRPEAAEFVFGHDNVNADEDHDGDDDGDYDEGDNDDDDDDDQFGDDEENGDDAGDEKEGDEQCLDTPSCNS
jgi:hypothetical protein